MAEFKLGRIKFLWKGDWTTGTPYIVDDIVSYNGKAYICVVNHTADVFNDELTDATPKWNLMTDGVTWGGAWTTNTPYSPGTIVQYGGLVYVCKTVHTSAATTTLGLEADQSKWDVFATSFYWAGAWTGTTRYRVGDIVKYGGYIYVCKTAHTSQSLLETDSSKWDVFNAGIEYKTNWADATYYKINDVVKFGADLYICTTAHTSSSTLDTNKFTMFVNGFQFESSWSNSTSYQVGDVVTYGGYTFVALQNHTNQNPSTAATYWSQFTTGFNLRGDWDVATAYKIGDVVRLGAYTYLALQDSTGTTPPNSSYWSQLNSGLKWKNTSTSYSAVASSNIVATGSGSPTFDVTRNNAVYTVTVHSGAAGTGYTVGDTLKVLGTAVGGQSPVNDITLTVATITGGGGTGPIGTVTATGVAVTWVTGTSYVLGDVVLYSANSYICVSPHTAGSGNRPDADTSGTYWNLLTAGAESAQLTTAGDTFYYSSSGPARLPIGNDGQILRVKNGLPSWGYFGQVNQLVYVAPTGTDRLDYGVTPETPLKTVRYAAKLVEDGYMNQNAKNLLAKNKQFILKEVSNYVNYVYSLPVGKTYSSADGSRPNQLELSTIATTAASSTGGTATITFSTQSVAPYAIGETIVIAGVTPANFNGTFTVTACSTTQVQFALVGTYGPQTVAGTISKSTTNFTANMPITFSANANGITAGTQYYVKTIVDSTHFTVSTSAGGGVVTLSTTGTVSTVGTYTNTQTKTERDAGLLLDGVIFDLSHGGTWKTVTNATNYFNTAGTSYVSGVSQYEITQFVAAQNYLNTLIGKILTNSVPTNNYQALSGQSTVASQIIDTTLTAESGASTTCASLISIVTTALTAGATSAIPAAIYPYTTISVKTGTYNEVLPIVIPSYTAVVGDELRSTVIQPKAANANLVADKWKTISALNRIKDIIPNLMSNTTITPTTGNTQGQIKTLPAGSAGSTTAGTAVGTSADIMYQIIDSGLTSVPTFIFTNPTGYNTSFLAGYGDGKAQIVQNYQFIKDEISSYLSTNYNSVWTALGTSGQASCTRDVGYILDALQYDMTYGGNTQSLIVGSSYYSNYVSTIAASERTAILATYTWLKGFIDNIVIKDTAGWTKTTSSSQVVTGTAGSAGAASFAQARIQDIIDWITNGYAPATVSPTAAIALASSSLQAAYNALQAKKSEIQADTVVWVQKNYQNISFNSTTCSRDAGYIVDALSYDLVFGTNFNAITVGRSYLRNISSVNVVMGSQKVAELNSVLFIKHKARMIANSGASAQAVTLLTDATTYIQGAGGVPFVWPSYSGITATDYAAAQLIFANKAFIQAETLAYITANYPAVAYDQGICSRDVGYIIDAVRYDMTYGGNYATRQAGLAYYSQLTSAFEIAASEKAATLAAYGNLKTLLQDIANGGLSSYTPLQVAVSYTTFNSGGDSSSATVVGSLIDGVTTTINGGSGSAPSETLPSTSWVASNLTTANSALQSARTTIRANVISYINTTYPTLSYDSTTCSRDIGLIIDAIGYDIMFGSNFRSQKAGASYWRAQANVVQALQKDATLNSLAYLKAQIASTLTDATALARANAYMDILIRIVTLGPVNSLPETHGTLTYNNTLATVNGAEILRANKTFLQYEASAWIAYTYPTYVFDAASCRRDVGEFVDAMIYDLQYPGNYKTLRAAQLYVNAINGSAKENMFLVRNATGLRNCTLNGLSGSLTYVNGYGTKRPTAGAYVALDPGFGPNDSNVWVTSRSHYSQNVTMFGTGCTGAKIDAALHAGGNKSMVKNDFTTILSDGIGVWATGSGALTELISVFNYYGYAGYLAELGARIRAANGNSSYGTYGVIAEGVDTYEVPITATVNNRAFSAQPTSTITDGQNQILRLEFGNAGTAYTNASIAISGAGYNAAATGDEFRDAAIFETRLVDNGDGTSTSVGGTSYVSAANAAQSGAIGQVTIANTDTALATAYVGMRIQITAGTGVGQYANIINYNNATKVALITKDSFTNLTVTGTTASADTLTVASTATLYANMPIYLSTAIGGASALTVYYVKSIASATTFTISTAASGSTFDITSDTSAQTVTLYAAGWDHVIPGTTTVNVLDLTTTYVIEPRLSYTSPGYTSTARTLPATATWTSATYAAGKFIAVSSGGTNAAQTSDGITWSSAGALPSTQTWNDVVYVGGEGATATAIVGGLGGSGAVLTAVLGTSNSLGLPQADQVASVTIVNGGVGYTTPPTIVFTGGSGSNATATCTVRNGAIASVTVTVNGSGYLTAPTCTAATDRITGVTINTSGKNYMNAANITVTFTGGGSSNQATGTAVLNSNQGVASISLSTYGTGYTSVPNIAILDVNAKFVAIANGANSTATQTIAGLVGPSAWTAGPSSGKTDLVAVAYGNGIAVAVGGTSATGSVVSSADFGTSWTDRSSTVNTANALGTGTYTGVAYGNGVFIAVNGGGGNKTSVSTNGTTTWAAGGALPFTTAVSIAYGNGRFVVLGSNGALAYSLDKGTTWTAVSTSTGTTTSVLSSSYTWTQIRYGQGQFMAIAQGTTNSGTSWDGINWTQRTISASSNWKGLAFGNPSSNPIWVAVSNTSGTAASSIRTGATPLARMKVTSNVATEIRMIEPGSGFPKGSVTATTASTNVITTSDTTNLVDSQPIEFTGLDSYGLTTNRTYYVIGSTIVSNTSFKVSLTAGSSTAVTLTTGTGLLGTYRAGPILTQTDPNKTKTASTRVRQGDGALGNPSFSNRGSGNTTATSTVSGDGYADLYQPGTYVAVSGLYTMPTPGANVQFGTISNTWYKLVSVTNQLGSAGNYTANFQINPALTTANAPAHGDTVTTRLKYSQVRLTGHDFLYIGTGNYASTNYPNVDPTRASQANQTNSSGGGRVFFTSTDQDGNFNVGNLFGVQQATGTATLNATAFNLAGLQSLQLGAVSLGVGSAIITQFSTDPYFTANSDSILPTQKAIKSYITSQIGGGASTLNVNTLTSGVIYISGNTITTTSGVQINITSKMNFTGGIDGAPVALAYFTQH